MRDLVGQKNPMYINLNDRTILGKKHSRTPNDSIKLLSPKATSLAKNSEGVNGHSRGQSFHTLFDNMGDINDNKDLDTKDNSDDDNDGDGSVGPAAAIDMLDSNNLDSGDKDERTRKKSGNWFDRSETFTRADSSGNFVHIRTDAIIRPNGGNSKQKKKQRKSKRSLSKHLMFSGSSGDNNVNNNNKDEEQKKGERKGSRLSFLTREDSFERDNKLKKKRDKREKAANKKMAKRKRKQEKRRLSVESEERQDDDNENDDIYGDVGNSDSQTSDGYPYKDENEPQEDDDDPKINDDNKKVDSNMSQ